MAPKNFHHPFEPYDIQQQFMEGVYQCIEQGKVGIFESPTGTGKSLSLICASLTWLREHKRKTYDEAVTTVELDDDEPDWMREHAVESRGQQIRQMRADFEARLTKVRERENKIKERNANANGEPPIKRQKRSHGAIEQDQQDDDQFVLDDYNSDDEHVAVKQQQYPPEVAKLMEKIGLLPKSDQERARDDETDELKIYFCSRTHSQLSQFTGELKRVRLPPGLPPEKDEEVAEEEIKQLTLGSRSNLCINPKVNKLTTSTAINEKCIELQQSSTPAAKKCSFLPNKDSESIVLDFRDHALSKLRDIEDLAKLGSKLQICPYYASRPAIGNAEIVTLPYPLLLQRAAREALGYSLKNHVVIIDEAHNLISGIEGTYSSQITDTQLQKAKSGLMTYLQKFRNRLKGSNRSYVTQVVRVMDSLLKFTNSVKDLTSTGDAVDPSALLAGKSVDQINLTKLVRYIIESKLARKVESYAAYAAQPIDNKQPSKDVSSILETADVPTLTHVQNFLTSLMNPSREGRFLWSKEDGSVVMRYLLLDPSEHFREIVEDARAVILAGGTMSPMDDYRQQLFPYLDSITTYSCGHLIPPTSIFVRAITSDGEGRIDFTFKSRNDGTASRLARALTNISGRVEGGMVIFFPSYGYLETALKFWKTDTTLLRLEAVKPLFCDSRSGSTERTFKLYSEAVEADKKRGALLLSVLGGKLSEGINFADDLGRCVVVVGLPFPNMESPDLKMKMQYLDRKALERGEPKGKASKEYVENVCMRSVNQAIGRVIRHKDDWASIILFDARYADARIQGKLPGWIRTSVDPRASGDAKMVEEGMKTFFRVKTADQTPKTSLAFVSA